MSDKNNNNNWWEDLPRYALMPCLSWEKEFREGRLNEAGYNHFKDKEYKEAVKYNRNLDRAIRMVIDSNNGKKFGKSFFIFHFYKWLDYGDDDSVLGLVYGAIILVAIILSIWRALF